MSLLMEALKKAEEAKRLAENPPPEAAPTATTELSLTPLSAAFPASPPSSPLPDLSLHFDSVDADLAAVSTEAPSKQRAPATTTKVAQERQREAAERTAVRNVFSAKQPPKSRSALWLLIGLGCIALLAGAAYFWWQLQAVSGGALAKSSPATPLFTQPPATLAATPAPAQIIAQHTEPPAEAAPFQAPPEQKIAPAEAPPVEPTFRPQKPSGATPSQPADGRVRLSTSQPKTNNTLERAYDALQQGRLEEAQRGYEQVLRSDPKNIDALLGIATIAAARGQTEQAYNLYQRALESDPNNATAQAGIINTRGQSDPGQSESRLKTALSNQPDSPALYFALGNLYAQQSRWSEAQQAYFRAYAGDPDNADFLFNLAVSLDHLHQNKLAAQYYQMALKTAETNAATRPVSFDRIQVRARIAELRP